MANKINIQQVEEAENLSFIVGVDQYNRWRKMKGKKIGDASAVAEIAQAAAEKAEEATQKATQAVNAASSAVETANEASQIASEAKNTADGIAGTANEAKSQSASAVLTAASARTAAEKNDGLLTGAMVWPNGGTVTVYTGNFVDGLFDPSPVTGQVTAGKFRALVLSYRTSTVRQFRLKGLTSYINAGLRGELTVAVLGGGSLALNKDSVSSLNAQGVVRPISLNNSDGTAFYIFKITVGGSGYATLECLYNCSFTPTYLYPIASQLILPTGGGATGPASGDLAGNYPAPTIKESVKLTGLPTVDTPDLSLLNKQIANTEFVKTFPKRWMVRDSGNPNVILYEDGQYILVPKEASLLQVITATGHGLQRPPIGDAARAYTYNVISMGSPTLYVATSFADEFVDGTLIFTGLSTSAPTLIKMIIALGSTSGTVYGYVVGTLLYK